METLTSFASTIQPPDNSKEIFKDDCMYCFTTCFSEDGIDICLHCFQSFCSKHVHDHFNAFGSHLIYLNYKKILKPEEEREENPTKIAKLEIKEKTEDELFDLETKIYNVKTDQLIDFKKDDLPMSITMTIDSVLQSRSLERKEEIKAWEQEIVPCEHSFSIKQSPISDLNLHQCSSCDLKENLWICLHCGNVGCGREQFGGIPGNSHAKAHFELSQHEIAVKLGSLTPDSADVFCYKCNDEIKVPDLAGLLKPLGINISDHSKTEKSLTELQLEQNLKWDFNMDGSNGELLKPVFGPKLTGMKNLGNTCYMASVLQVLFSFDNFAKEFYGKSFDFTNKDSFKDLQTQLIKIANGLLSGDYSVPDETTSDTIKYQQGIKPSGFKSLIGKDHVEFSTMKQQDSFEFWCFLLDKIDELYAHNFDQNPTNIFKFVVETKLATEASEIKLKDELNNSISLPITAQVLSVDEDGRKIYKPVTFESMFDQWHSPELIELSNKNFQKTSSFRTFPDVLVVNAQRIQLENWVPIKVDVPITLPEILDLSAYKAEGKLDNETLIQDDDDTTGTSWEPNAAAQQQLQEMGFPEARCAKLLYNTGNSSLEDAMNWLFQHMDDPDIDDPVEFRNALKAGNNGPPLELVDQVMAMGFLQKLAIKSLVVNNNNLDLAINWIFENPDDEGDLPSAPVAKLSDSEIISKLTSGDATDNTTYSLYAIICHKGNSVQSGHYVCFIKKLIDGDWKWVLFNDEKVVISDETNVKEMESNGYMYLFLKNI